MAQKLRFLYFLNFFFLSVVCHNSTEATGGKNVTTTPTSQDGVTEDPESGVVNYAWYIFVGALLASPCFWAGILACCTRRRHRPAGPEVPRSPYRMSPESHRRRPPPYTASVSASQEQPIILEMKPPPYKEKEDPPPYSEEPETGETSLSLCHI